MEKILLLEANYRNKFPPVGLMKIAYYHTNIKCDFVWFSKGELPARLSTMVEKNIQSDSYYGGCADSFISQANMAIAEKTWDRVYVTTLFTFEWDKTIAMIEYAKSLVDDTYKVVVGGISATLMAREIEEATGIKPICGLIEDSSQLGYDSGVCVDALIPDYSVLNHIEYQYPKANGYFLTATRGCGNKCSFCAVQTLEPDYKDYLPIIPRIREIEKLYGEKRNLYLLDNNVLKSSCFTQIISDIKDAGFQRGAKWLNPNTGNPNKRIVDFNQGLDAKLLNEETVALLSTIALEPAHIAFDNISDKDVYIKAVRLLDKHNIRNISSYLLYNTRRISSKGTVCDADCPTELYDRMRIGYELNCEINNARKKQELQAFDVFSFPMRFVPLNSKNRSFIGDNWNPKLLAGVQSMLQPSHGGVFATPDYFNYMYGANSEEFLQTLLFPQEYIRHKGKPASKYSSGRHIHHNWMLCISEWKKIYETLDSGQLKEFEDIISSNVFSAEAYMSIQDKDIKSLYLHYITGKSLPNFLSAFAGSPEFHFISDYIQYECPAILWCSLEACAQGKQSVDAVTKLAGLLYNRHNIELAVG